MSQTTDVTYFAKMGEFPEGMTEKQKLSEIFDNKYEGFTKLE